jgi:hypothetical protein
MGADEDGTLTALTAHLRQLDRSRRNQARRPDRQADRRRPARRVRQCGRRGQVRGRYPARHGRAQPRHTTGQATGASDRPELGRTGAFTRYGPSRLALDRGSATEQPKALTPSWADRYDWDLTDIFAVQDEVTHEILGTLSSRSYGGRPKAAPGTANLRPTTRLLRGANRRGCTRARSALTSAACSDAPRSRTFLDRNPKPFGRRDKVFPCALGHPPSIDPSDGEAS